MVINPDPISGHFLEVNFDDTGLIDYYEKQLGRSISASELQLLKDLIINGIDHLIAKSYFLENFLEEIEDNETKRLS